MRILKSTLNLLLIFFLFYFISCSKYKRADPTGHPPSLNQEREDSYLSNSELATEFADGAIRDGMLEVQQAKIALERSQNDQVKELAESIRQDHEEANARLKEIGRANHWNLPMDITDQQKQKLNMLMTSHADTFDEEYLKMMADAHRKALAIFQRVAGAAPDPDHHTRTDEEADGVHPQLLDWIRETLPILQKHLDRSQELLEDLPQVG